MTLLVVRSREWSVWSHLPRKELTSPCRLMFLLRCECERVWKERGVGDRSLCRALASTRNEAWWHRGSCARSCEQPPSESRARPALSGPSCIRTAILIGSTHFLPQTVERCSYLECEAGWMLGGIRIFFGAESLGGVVRSVIRGDAG